MKTNRTLPQDVARCLGVGDDEEGWREGGEECLRRTSPPGEDYQVLIDPPPIIVFVCEYLIDDATPTE